MSGFVVKVVKLLFLCYTKKEDGRCVPFYDLYNGVRGIIKWLK